MLKYKKRDKIGFCNIFVIKLTQKRKINNIVENGRMMYNNIIKKYTYDKRRETYNV